MPDAKGRVEACAFGRREAGLKLPTGEVLASMMCRTLVTERLMFGPVKPQNDLCEGEPGDYPGASRCWLRRWPLAASAGLLVMATPSVPWRVRRIWAEGGTAAMLPEGTHWRSVARVLPDE